MSGPPYPPPPPAGSNGIGLFKIGVSQIGDIAPFTFWETVISQYANSPIMMQLLANLDACIDQTQNFSNFYDLIWNVLTAQGYGLDVWGRIVGVNRVVRVPYLTWFGFAEALPGSLSFGPDVVMIFNPSLGFGEATSWVPFGSGTFGLSYQWTQPADGGGIFYGGGPTTTNFTLDDETYRKLILAKAAANITNGSIPAINQILVNLFPGRGNAFVTDGYQGGFYFGFAESRNAETFGQGTFYSGQVIQSMTMTYTFDFPLSAIELGIVGSSGVLPKPTGVALSIVINA